MTDDRRYGLRASLGDLCLLLLIAGLASAAWIALDIHASADWVLPLRLLTLLALGLALVLRITSKRAAWIIAGLTAIAHLGWFLALTPSATRDWAAPVVQSTTGEITDGIARLNHIRDFTWSTPDIAQETWIDGIYDLSQIARVDLLTSVWDNPEIAHILVSFQFQDGRDLAFSIEVRREAHEAFSIRGGFLREFELALIAAPERDLVDLRVDIRGEEVRRYPTTLTPEQGARLFAAYVDLGNSLIAEPRFYNTITANCTTVAWSIAHVLKDDLPLDWRLILSGRLPEYLDAQGVLMGEMDTETRRAQALIVPSNR